MKQPQSDLVLAGGGLANGLIALRLAERRPEISIRLVEAGDKLGGNHTWSFHETDLTPEQRAWVAPLVVHRWPHYEVAFPGFQRRMQIPYCSVSSDRFHAVLTERLGERVLLGASILELAPDGAGLASGAWLGAAGVLDGRGFRPSPQLRLAWQKFVGLELRLAAPHGLTGPMLMDASVPQHDGFRFVYVLPLGQDRVLVEDTYYADHPALDADLLRGRIEAYAADRGWQAVEWIREERGVLPITLSGRLEALWADARVPPVGLRAGLFHATTGYSLPEAVRLADRLAALPDLSTAALHGAIARHARAVWRGQAFHRMLNRMLFLAGAPADRRKVLQRFYTLPEGLIARFYAGRLTAADKLRLLAGKPPVPIGGAMRAVLAGVRQ